jgi:hypothetical protein
MLALEKGNRAVSESEVKVTLKATATGEPVRKAALNVQGSFEERSGR